MLTAESSVLHLIVSAFLAFGRERRDHGVDAGRRRRGSRLRIRRPLSSKFCASLITTFDDDFSTEQFCRRFLV